MSDPFIAMFFNRPIFCSKKFLSVAILAVFFSGLVHAKKVVVEPPEGVGIIERRGAVLPLSLSFTNESGEKVPLKQFFTGNKPVIITPVYYGCPNLCNLILNGMLEATLSETKYIPGRDYTVVSFSINPQEGYEIAAAKKKNYLEKFPDEDTKDIKKGWHFLTSGKEEIDRLTETLGFRYKKDGEDYLHPAVIAFATPDGRLSRYLYGVDFPKSDFRLAILESSEGKIGGMVEAALLYCYSYDPATKRYNLLAWRVMRIGAVGLAGIFLAGLFVFLLRDSRRRKREL